MGWEDEIDLKRFDPKLEKNESIFKFSLTLTSLNSLENIENLYQQIFKTSCEQSLQEYFKNIQEKQIRIIKYREIVI